MVTFCDVKNGTVRNSETGDQTARQ